MSVEPLSSVDPWRAIASRAAHPSQQVADLLEPGDLLGQIAAGLGAVVVPPTWTGAAPTSLERTLLLTTAAYDVWLMQWPSGTVADPHSHELPVAFHVVSGEIIERRAPVGTPTVHAEGATVVVPANTLHRLESPVSTTTVHVHAKEAL